MTSRLLGLAAAAALGVSALMAPAIAGHQELGQIIEARSDEDKARDTYRHPKETLEFFGVTPSSRVVEALPGGGWYSRIILPLVSEKGAYVGSMYAVDMQKKVFPGMTEERVARAEKWAETFPARAAEWVEGEPEIGAFNMGSAPEDLYGTMDHVLMIRAIHHLNRAGDTWFEDAVVESYELLKPGGVVGVVQHEAPADADDAWAVGNAGYVKKARVIEVFEEAGFELAGDSDINANPKDKPTTDDVVWRLPPSLGGDQSDEVKAKNKAIGESNRMTLKFVKPQGM